MEVHSVLYNYYCSIRIGKKGFEGLMVRKRKKRIKKKKMEEREKREKKRKKK
jgi:hypothetical protein